MALANLTLFLTLAVLRLAGFVDFFGKAVAQTGPVIVCEGNLPTKKFNRRRNTVG
jgi:hypothetical protein